MDRIPISKQGFEKISQEFEDLKAQRPAIIQAIAEARAEGDLSENAGYDAARERQGMLEARISYINSRMPLFDVLDLNTLDGDQAIFGATVEVEDIDTEERRTFTLLGPDDADHKKGSISVLSPMGLALLGKEEGDEFIVDAPRGRIEYEIISVKFLGTAGLNLK
ncbi:transcription elongation factor GreA [Desulfovibrio sp. Huiquan2017]|uniref:transcription elongation factor GreA n=1 Tax=Desulfovibrio sp. Huiquan2017 TaxID=2816861 RepID=UPI001A937E7E|nr:transcription elongation factor GreA [Desulfovibrio sp. Huiquan2017]